METSVVPKLTRKQVKNTVSADMEGWKNFAQRITKNPFVKTFLLQRDGNNCAWCKKKLTEIKIVHHTTYEHACTYNKEIQTPTPTLTNPKKTRTVPDCEGCKDDNYDRFIACMNKLVLVHGYCNKQISEKTHQATNIELSS